MLQKIIFTSLFLFSLLGIYIASFEDWLILTLILQILWITLLSNKIIESSKNDYRIYRIFAKINVITICILIVDLLIIFLSISFAFRIFLAYLYQPIFYLSIICIIISIVGNYYIVFNELNNRNVSFRKKICLFVASLIYPLGVYIVKTGSEIKTGANNV